MHFIQLLLVLNAASVPRNVHIKDQQFILTKTGAPIVLGGPNVVVKGPPYMPAVTGTTHCEDKVDDNCSKTGTFRYNLFQK